MDMVWVILWIIVGLPLSGLMVREVVLSRESVYITVQDILAFFIGGLGGRYCYQYSLCFEKMTLFGGRND